MDLGTNKALPSDDVIFDGIMPRLPAKSIGRFRCVCKSWYHRTSNPSFIQTHLQHAVQRNHSSLLMSSNLKVDFCLDGYKLMGSCNGIVCYVKENQVFLFNPCTKEFKSIRFPHDLLMKPRTNYNYDWFPYEMFGFGYDSDEDDYQVVMFESPVYKTKIHIHSLKDTSCNTLAIVDDGYACNNNNANTTTSPGVYLNGTLHWLMEHLRAYGLRSIFSFGIKNNVFQEFEVPKDEYAVFDGIVVIGGKLCVSSSIRNAFCLSENSTCVLEIWVMQEYGDDGSWSKLFSLSRTAGPEIATAFISLPFFLKKEILVEKHVEDEILLDMDGQQHKLLYHPERQTIRLVKVSSCTPLRGITTHIASLTTLASVGRVKSP